MMLLRKYIIYLSALMVVVLGLMIDIRIRTSEAVFLPFSLITIIIAIVLLFIGFVYSRVRRKNITNVKRLLIIDACATCTSIPLVVIVFFAFSDLLFGYSLIENKSLLAWINLIGVLLFILSQVVLFIISISKKA